MVDQTDEREKYRLAGRGFDDCGLSNTGCVEVYVSTFFGGFFFYVKI